MQRTDRLLKRSLRSARASEGRTCHALTRSAPLAAVPREQEFLFCRTAGKLECWRHFVGKFWKETPSCVQGWRVSRATSNDCAESTLILLTRPGREFGHTSRPRGASVH